MCASLNQLRTLKFSATYQYDVDMEGKERGERGEGKVGVTEHEEGTGTPDVNIGASFRQVNCGMLPAPREYR